MKKIFLFLIFLLIIPLAFGDITILAGQDIYNLGNKIGASASVLQEADFEGLLKLAIKCNDYTLQYYTTPVSLEASSRTAVDVPELTATSSMLGNCVLIGTLATNNNLLIEEKSSNSFEITYKLEVLPVNSNITALPSDSIKIAGVVNEAFGNNLLKAGIKVSLDNSTYETDAIDGKFDISIGLPKAIKSGKHYVEITASDSKDNMGSAAIYLEIVPVEKYVRLELSEQSVNPGKKIGIMPYLHDQADGLMNASVSLEMTHENKEKIFSKTLQSNEKIEYEFSQYAKPGNYILMAAYESLQSQAVINVSALREIQVKYENQSVFIENIGNVPFIDELTFIVQNELGKYPLIKKISIEPGKMLSIDLSREVPEGIYNVLLEKAKDLAAPSDELNESVSAASESILAENAKIDDNRPVYKKIGSGLSAISGILVGADGVLTKNPLVAPIILTAIILLVVVRYGRKPLIKLLKRDKKEETENKEN